MSIESRNLLVKKTAHRIASGKIGRIGAREDISQSALGEIAELGLLGDDVGIVHPRSGIAQRQRTYAIRRRRGKSQYSPSAHRLTSECRTLNTKMVEQLAQVFDKGAGTGAIG